ncbi:MAG: tetratricopeptide repeat protein [Leptospira sp.]|nr:tetratricopeptide repeat protein [Leptospira sp.]
MNRSIIVLTGFLFISAGILTAVYHSVIKSEEAKLSGLQERIREGEELLGQSSKASHEKALAIFSELSGKDSSEKLKFRIRFRLANSLEKNKDELRSLEIYKELNLSNQNTNIEDKENLSYSIGNLLLKLNREEEGRSHLDEVLKKSQDKKIRSKALASLADFYFRKNDMEKARKNYILAVQENPENIHARIGWGKTLYNQGRDWASYEIFDDYLSNGFYFDQDSGKVAAEYKSSVYERGKKFYTSRQYYKAIEYLKKSISLKEGGGTEEKALYYIAESYNALGRSSEALKYIDKVLTNENSSLDQTALYRKGTIYFRIGNYEKAASVFDAVMDKYPRTSVSDRAAAWKRECIDQISDDVYLRSKDKKQPAIDSEDEE